MFMLWNQVQILTISNFNILNIVHSLASPLVSWMAGLFEFYKFINEALARGADPFWCLASTPLTKMISPQTQKRKLKWLYNKEETAPLCVCICVCVCIREREVYQQCSANKKIIFNWRWRYEKLDIIHARDKLCHFIFRQQKLCARFKMFIP